MSAWAVIGAVILVFGLATAGLLVAGINLGRRQCAAGNHDWVGNRCTRCGELS